MSKRLTSETVMISWKEKKKKWMTDMVIKITIAVLMITCLTLTGLSANSIFSFQGFPNHESNADIYGSGMGETGIGDVYRINTGYLNPSLSTTLNQVYFSTGIKYGFFYYYDDRDNDFRTDGLHFPYFNATIPLSRHRVGFDFAPLLSGNVDQNSPDRTVVINGEEFHFSESQKVRSYLYKGSLFYAYNHRIVNIGFSLDYYLGHRFKALSQNYTGVTGFINPRYEFNQTFRSPGFTAGMNKRFGNFAFGAMYRSAAIMEGEEELVAVHSVFDIGDSSFELPHRLGLGTAYRLNNNYRLTVDFEYELWNGTDSYTYPSDTYRAGLGIAYEPHWGNDRWYQRIPLRAGGYYRTLPFLANGNDLSEFAATFGFTIPLQSPNNRIDFSLKYLVRGDTGENTYQDRSLLFGIGLSGFDFFRSRPRRIADREIPQAEFEGYM